MSGLIHDHIASYLQHQHDPELVTLRSTETLQAMCESDTHWQDLSPHAQLAITQGARALVQRRRAHPEDIATEDLLTRLSTWIEPLCTLQVQGLSLSYYPTPSHTCLRFIQHAHISSTWQSFFDMEPAEFSHLTAAFVDPEEFHFRTFEHIVPMDRFFDGTRMTMRLHDLNEMIPERAWCWRAKPGGALRERLLALDDAGLYLKPLNAGSRGGERLIFHSAALAKLLTQTVRKTLPETLTTHFSHINPVFRLNRFSPRDANFTSHHDTPYADRARGHISRYTLLLYMTGGHASPALRLENDALLDEIAPWTCVIFDQSMEHEGRVFERGDKVFLRTELVFTHQELTHDPHIASLFSKACALTGESLFDTRIAQHVHDTYDRVAQAHFTGLSPTSKPQDVLFLHKQFRHIHYVCNGHDYWFDASQLSLQACASMVILDYFNCKMGGSSFRKLCTRDVLADRHGQDWIAKWLCTQPSIPDDELPMHFDTSQLFPRIAPVDEDVTFPDELHELNDDVVRGFEQELYMQNASVHATYETRRKLAQSMLHGAPILIMGKEVWLDERQYVVHGNQIFIGSQTPMEPVNFAASTSWTHAPEDYVNTRITIDAPHLLIPPILFTRRDDGLWHLMCDFFKNGWMVTHKSHRAEVPQFTWPW